AVAAAGGVAIAVPGVPFGLHPFSVAFMLLAGGLLAGGASFIAAFRLRHGVLVVPLESVSPALVGGRVWARDRGSLHELAPDGAAATGDVERALANIRTATEPARRQGDDLTPLLEKAAVFIVFAAVVIVLFTVINPSMFFSTTLPAGGDMGSHHYIPQELARFLPFRMSGWSDGWYAGFPMLHFYFPLPYALIVALEKVVGYGFAFRVVSLSGVFGFPFACYWSLR